MPPAPWPSWCRSSASCSTCPAYERAPAELQRRRSFEAVTSFVRGLADQQPLLLVVDDLHLAGASTLELLHF
jgi:predicted ATPase